MDETETSKLGDPASRRAFLASGARIVTATGLAVVSLCLTIGVQYGNGLFGPFVVEEASPIATYDRDEVLLVNDWFRELGDDLLAGLMKSPPAVDMPVATKAAPKPDMPAKKVAGMEDKSGMAMSMRDVGDIPFQSGLFNGKGRAPGTNGPLTTVEFNDGETIRLRLINGSSATSSGIWPRAWRGSSRSANAIRTR